VPLKAARAVKAIEPLPVKILTSWPPAKTSFISKKLAHYNMIFP
jgi:hypothetical protein